MLQFSFIKLCKCHFSCFCFFCSGKIVFVNTDFIYILYMYRTETVHRANSKWKWLSISPWSGDFGVRRAHACHYVVIWNELGKGRDVISSLSSAGMFPWQRSTVCIIRHTDSSPPSVRIFPFTATLLFQPQLITTVYIQLQMIIYKSSVCCFTHMHTDIISYTTFLWDARNLQRRP